MVTPSRRAFLRTGSVSSDTSGGYATRGGTGGGGGGQGEHLEPFAGRDQGVHQPGGVSVVDVLVEQTVDQKQVAPDVGRAGQDRRLLVPLRVALRRAHVALGIAGVVPVPVGDRGD